MTIQIFSKLDHIWQYTTDSNVEKFKAAYVAVALQYRDSKNNWGLRGAFFWVYFRKCILKIQQIRIRPPDHEGYYLAIPTFRNYFAQIQIQIVGVNSVFVNISNSNEFKWIL